MSQVNDEFSGNRNTLQMQKDASEGIDKIASSFNVPGPTAGTIKVSTTSSQPSNQPSNQSSGQPSNQPSNQPSGQPSGQSSGQNSKPTSNQSANTSSQNLASNPNNKQSKIDLLTNYFKFNSIGDVKILKKG